MSGGIRADLVGFCNPNNFTNCYNEQSVDMPITILLPVKCTHANVAFDGISDSSPGANFYFYRTITGGTITSQFNKSPNCDNPEDTLLEIGVDNCVNYSSNNLCERTSFASPKISLYR